MAEREHTAQWLSPAESWWVPSTATTLGFCLTPQLAGHGGLPRVVFGLLLLSPKDSGHREVGQTRRESSAWSEGKSLVLEATLERVT